MANLLSKLRQLKMPDARALEGCGPALSAPAGESDSARTSTLRARLAQAAHRFSERQTQASLPGAERCTDHGPVYIVEERESLSHYHGSAALAGALEVTIAQLRTLTLDSSLPTQLDTSRLLYLDTETTGLAGGTGTVAFLVGIATLTQQGWHSEQLLLRRPGEEEPLLRYLQGRLADASGLVTFNGKSFDWPLLKSRFVMNRLPIPATLPHIDLLHCARRLLRRSHLSLRLTAIEEALLGFARLGDIDGAAIPTTYFSYLRGAPAAVLAPIITHNRNDLVAMAAILTTLAQRLKDPQGTSHADCLAVAELTLRAGHCGDALAFAQAAALGADGAVTAEALMLVAKLALAAGQYDAAVAALQASLAGQELGAVRRAAAHLILAKLQEHRLKDLLRALEHAHQTAPAEGIAAHEHRVRRLQRKLGAFDQGFGKSAAALASRAEAKRPDSCRPHPTR